MKHHVDLGFGCNQGRAEGDNIAQRTDDNAMMMRPFGQEHASTDGSGEWRAGGLIGNQFNSPNKADAANFAYKGMV